MIGLNGLGLWTAAALSAGGSGATLSFASRIVAAGDSLTDNGNVITATSSVDVGTSYWLWGLFGARGRLVPAFGADQGVGGNTSAMLLARFDADVLAKDPDAVLLLIGTNDVRTDIPALTTLANIREMITKCRAQRSGVGIPVYLGKIPPQGFPGSPMTGAQVIEWERNNTGHGEPAYLGGIAAMAAPDVFVWDCEPTVGNMDANHTFQVGMTHLEDGIHFGALGGQLVGLEHLAPLINGSVASGDGLFATNNAADNHIANGFMTGTGGSLLGGATGQMATGWAGTDSLMGGGTLSFQKVSRADGFGEWLQHTISGNYTGNQRSSFASVVNAAPTIDNPSLVVAECEVEVDSLTNVGALGLVVSFNGTDIIQHFAISPGGDDSVPAAPFTGVIRTVPFFLDIDATSITLATELFLKDAAGSTPCAAVVRYGRVGLRTVLPFAVVPSFASIGDSQVQNGVVTTATTKSYVPEGTLTQLRRMSRQKVIYPIANQVGVGGTVISAIKATAATAVATGAKFCLYCGGTNDGPSGAAGLPGRQQDVVDTFETLMNGGMTPIVLPLIRRVDGSKSADTDAFCDGLNAWYYAGGILGTATGGLVVRAMSLAEALLAPPAPGTRAIIVDFTSLVNPSTQEALADVLKADGLHHNALTAFTAATQINALINAYGASPDNMTTAGTDLWALQAVNHGLLAGTTGTELTQSGFTGSGITATGYQLNYTGGPATWTGVNSKITGLGGSGDGQRLVTSGAANSQATESCNNQCLTNLTTGVNVGDTVYGEIRFRVTDPANFRGLRMQIREVGPASPVTASEASSTTTWQNFDHEGVMRTDPIVLQAGTTAISTILTYAHVGNIGAFGATIDVSDYRIMKLP